MQGAGFVFGSRVHTGGALKTTVSRRREAGIGALCGIPMELSGGHEEMELRSDLCFPFNHTPFY